jgi:dethiobiotin synthase
MRLFVTGTDTDVGKSVVTACLAAAARAHGTVVACKPVASGVPAGTAGEDALRIARGAGHDPLVFTTWSTPVSPHRAAWLEGRPVVPDLLERVRALQADTVLVEGAGGWRVPVAAPSDTTPAREALWMKDLAAATGGPCIVVAADKLGVLNHTLLTVEAIRRDGLQVLGVVLNQGLRPEDDISTSSNEADLRWLLDVPLAVAPHVPDHPGAENLWAHVGQQLFAQLGVIESGA